MHAQKNSVSWSSQHNEPSTADRTDSDASYSGTLSRQHIGKGNQHWVRLFGDSTTSDSLPDELASQCGESVSSPDLQSKRADILNQQSFWMNGSLRYGPVTLSTLCLMTDMHKSDLDKRYRQYKTSFQKLFNEAIRVHKDIQKILLRKRVTNVQLMLLETRRRDWYECARVSGFFQRLHRPSPSDVFKVGERDKEERSSVWAAYASLRLTRLCPGYTTGTHSTTLSLYQ